MEGTTGLAAQRPAGGAPRDPQAEYGDVRHRIHGLVGCLTDRDSTVLVVSKGDQGLVQFESSQGWHFPRTADGKYAGHHPADASEAVAQLEELRGQGAQYFVLPSTYFWWLSHYEGLARHLRSRYRLVADCPDTCLIYDLRAGPVTTGAPVARPSESSPKSNGAGSRDPQALAIRALLDSLLADREPVLVVGDGHDELRLGRVTAHYPPDSRQARGIRYVVVPATIRPEAGAVSDLREHGREVATREGVCAIYELEHAECRGPADG